VSDIWKVLCSSRVHILKQYSVFFQTET